MTQLIAVKEARERHKPPLTQEQLATAAAIDQTYVSLIESGKRIPSDEIRKRLAKALGIAPSRLRFSEPEPELSVAAPDDRAGHGRARRTA
jgi:transcriptional regulator with XRE-family HTH domain